MATPVVMPRQGQSVESCILVEWLVKAGDTVAQGAPLANIETDKAVFEVESPAAGVVLNLFFEAGADIPVLTNIAAIGNPGEDVAALRPAAVAAAAGSEPAAATAAPAAAAAVAPPAATGPAVGVSPRARWAAQQVGIDAAVLSGSGPGGRVVERDVRAAPATVPHVSATARAALAATGAALPASGTGPGGMVVRADLGRAAAGAAAATARAAVPAAAPAAEVTAVPLNTIRRLIAERMRASLATTAQLTLQRAFDATALLAFRAHAKAKGEALGLPNITINDAIVFVVSRLLVKMPEFNAHFLGNRIARFAHANIGVAMDTPRGLMVPVLRAADTLSLAEISRRLKPITEAARQGTIGPDLLSGGTFTVTNMGMLGIETFTPILNAPEVAILGVGGLIWKPVSDGKGGVRHIQALPLSLTIDHQAVDGGLGARFLQALAESLENMELALAQ